MKTFLFIATTYLTLLLSSSIQGCKVTFDGVDKTDEFLVTGPDKVQYVDCEGKSKCKNAIIENCSIIKCSDTEACFTAQIIDFTQSVICTGLHSCHLTEIQAAATGETDRAVICEGPTACAKANIYGNLQQVSCVGGKACRHTSVKGAKLIKCQDGAETAPACLNLATFQTDCLYCGTNGCSSRINQCRYKSLDATPDDPYNRCQPGTIVGNNCPAVDLTGGMELETIKEEKVKNDEGGERIRNLRRN
jgi:hypothetical protein